MSSGYVRGTWSNTIPRACDTDPVAVHRLIGGDRTVHATVPDRTEAIAIMTNQGMSAATIATIIGCSDRTVFRYRRRANLLARAERLGWRLAVAGQFHDHAGDTARDLAGRHLVSQPDGSGQYRWVVTWEESPDV